MWKVVEYDKQGEVKWSSEEMTFPEAKALWEKKAHAVKRRFAIRKAV